MDTSRATIIKTVKRIALGLTLLPFSLVLTVQVIGWNWAKNYVEYRVTQATGREFTIAGDLDIDLSLHPLIRAETIRLGNAPWARFQNLVEIKTLALRLDLVALIQGRIVIPQLSISKPVVRLAVSKRGDPNWRLSPARAPQPAASSKHGGPLAFVHRVVIEDGEVTYRDYSNGADLLLRITRLLAYTDAARNQIALAGEGHLAQQPWRVALRAGSFRALRADQPYPVDLALALADTRANVEGTLTKPLRLESVDLSVSVEGLNLSMLSPFLTAPRPQLPHHMIEGRLIHKGKSWRLQDFQVVVGDSKLQGRLALDTGGERPTIKADLSSDVLRYEDFAGLAPLAQDKKPQPLDFSALRTVNAVINLNANEILTPVVAVGNLQVAARLDEGRLSIDPQFDVGGGQLHAEAEIDASPTGFDAYLAANIQQVHLSKMDDRARGIEGLKGILNGHITAYATGATGTHGLSSKDSARFIDNLVIGDTQLSYRLPGEDARLRITLDTKTANGQQRLETAGGGSWRGEAFEIALASDSLLALVNTAPNRPYAIAGKANFAGIEFAVDGALEQPLALDGIDLAFSASGAGTAQLPAALSKFLPEVPPFELEGRLTRQDARWKIAELEARAGKSHFAGDIMVAMAGEKPYLRADLFSDRLNVNDFAALLRMSNDAQTKARPFKAPSANKTPAPLNLNALQSLDADVRLEAEAIIAPNLLVEALTADIALHNGRLTVEPFKLELAEGTARGKLVLDSTIPVRGALMVNVEQLNTKNVLKPRALDATSGVLDGHAEVSFIGATAEQIAAVEPSLLSTIHRFRIQDTHFTYRDPGSRTDLELTVATTTTANGSKPLRVQGDGRYQGEPFDLNITAGSPLRLFDQQNAYPIDGSIEIANTKAELQGSITQPLKLKGLNLDLSLKGPNPNRLQDFIGLPLPDLLPYEIEGRLSRGAASWRFEDFRATMGNSDLAGNLSVTTSGERMFLRAALVSDKVDLVQIFGPAEPAGNSSILPNTAIDLSPLRVLDGEISYRAKRIYVPGQTFVHLSTEIALNEGHLTLEPLIFDYLGGTFDSHIEVAANETPVRTSVDAKLQKLSLNEILANFDAADQGTGVISLGITLEGDGRSLADFAASADGSIWLVLRDGRINELLLEAAGLDLIQSLSLIDEEGSEPVSTCTVQGPWCAAGSRQAEQDDTKEQKESESVSVRCLVADFWARNGVLAAQTFIMDTAGTKVVGSGTIALGSESIDLKLLVHAKDFSILAGQAPLHIRGNFRDLNVEVSKARIAFSLLTPIELGTADSADCQRLIQAVRQP